MRNKKRREAKERAKTRSKGSILKSFRGKDLDIARIFQNSPVLKYFVSSSPSEPLDCSEPSRSWFPRLFTSHIGSLLSSLATTFFPSSPTPPNRLLCLPYHGVGCLLLAFIYGAPLGLIQSFFWVSSSVYLLPPLGHMPLLPFVINVLHSFIQQASVKHL